MRLLEVSADPPRQPKDKRVDGDYAILSHTWSTNDEDEVVFSDLKTPEEATKRPGWKKLRGALDQAARDGYSKIWIDTCCINKESSAELSEAINSMYQWYRDSAVCYVYLEDFECESSEVSEDYSLSEREKSNLRNCRWFTRGWTLQGLIAPRAIRFFDKKWKNFGSLETLADTVHHITRIHLELLEKRADKHIFQHSAANVVGVATRHYTTRRSRLQSPRDPGR